MRKREGILPLTSFFILLTVLILFFGNTVFSAAVMNAGGVIMVPIQRAIFFILSPLNGKQSSSDEKQFQLISQDIQNRESDREMQALRDQFNTASPEPAELLPSQIIGFGGFIPAVHNPITITLDRGSSDGVKVGQAVVYKNNLVGKIDKVNTNRSRVLLLTNEKLSFTAESVKNNAIGVVHGGEEAIIMDNIVLSEKIETGEIIVTKGEMNVDGNGLPPGLVVGKVVSTDKRQSNLFQIARVQSLVDISSLSTVFILIQ